MKREYHRWHSPRLGIELGVVVYGHYGPPLLGFPTSAPQAGQIFGRGCCSPPKKPRIEFFHRSTRHCHR